MSKIKIFCFILLLLAGVFMVVYGGRDDSPGGQLLGVLAVIISIAGIIKSAKKTSGTGA